MSAHFNNRDPVYLQVIRSFKEQLATGKLQPGQDIPSRRELAGLMGINPNTAQRAYKEMEEQGLIHTERNFPSKITTDEAVLSTVREELINEAIEAFVASVHSINLSLDEVLTRVKEKFCEGAEAEQEGDHD
jgi:DNA-binding transcriptional regulator YhcF (GntR family)